jgi:hypothetical protein
VFPLLDAGLCWAESWTVRSSEPPVLFLIYKQPGTSIIQATFSIHPNSTLSTRVFCNCYSNWCVDSKTISGDVSSSVAAHPLALLIARHDPVLLSRRAPRAHSSRHSHPASAAATDHANVRERPMDERLVQAAFLLSLYGAMEHKGEGTDPRCY